VPAWPSHLLQPPAARRLVAIASGLLLVLGLAACGGDSQGAAAPAGQRGQGPFGIAQDPQVRACLKTHGVTLPARGRRSGPPPGAGPRTTTGAQTTTGAPPPRPRGPRRDPAQFAKLQAALKACGVSAPAGRRGTARGGPPPTQTAPSAGTS
jgi:hypothetical protein